MFKNRHHTEITKERIRKALMGRRFSPKTEFEKGHPQSNTGRTHFKKGHITWNKDVPCGDLAKQKISKILMGNKNKPRKHILQKKLENLYIKQGYTKGECASYFYCSIHTISDRMRKYGIPSRSNLHRRIPSSLEKKFQTIIDKYNLPYKFVGNGKFTIGHYNPDFININSEKIAIEVYARYYKLRCNKSIEKWKRERGEIFQEYGWSIIYFNEIEVNNEEYVLKILGGD